MAKQKRVSYIRKPYAKNSFLSLGLALGALVLGILEYPVLQSLQDRRS